MVNIGRKLGVNIYTRMLEAEISPDSFARYLGYSMKDMGNVIDGKVIIPPAELEKIADFLKTTKSELLNEESDSLIPGSHYMKGFSDPDNLDKILDLMDGYVELKEGV